MPRTCPVLPRMTTTTHAITSTKQVLTAVARFDSTPSMPTFARMLVRAANTAEATAYQRQDSPLTSWSCSRRSSIMNVPTRMPTQPTSLTTSPWVSPKRTMARMTVSTVEHLSMGTTLFTSPSERARK